MLKVAFMSKWVLVVFKVIVAFLSCIVLLFLLFIYFYADIKYDIGVTRFMNKSSSISQFQSIFQLGAAFSLTFAFAGPKIGDLFLRENSEVVRTQVSIKALKSANNLHVLERIHILENTLNLINIYDYRWQIVAEQRVLTYSFITAICFILLFISSFSQMCLQNTWLIILSVISLIMPFFEVIIMGIEVRSVKNAVELIRLLVLYSGYSSTAFDNLKESACSQLTRILAKVK